MKMTPAATCALLLPLLLALGTPMRGVAAQPAARAPIYANLQGEVLLDNQRVLVEKYVLQPGHSTGRHSHPGDQLLVFVRGGVLKSAATQRSTLWRDGRVMWQGSLEAADEGGTNAGSAPIEMIWVTLKPVPAGAPAAAAAQGSAQTPKKGYLNYPNIPGEDLLENDLVIVQRFTVNPGQWEGVHAHHPDMLYIHIKGGQWAARSYKQAEHAYPNPSPDGEVGWMDTIGLEQGHESGNIGKTPIDLIWVTLKK